MSLHLVKLAVGIDSIDHLQERQTARRNQNQILQHVTRMTPRRGNELLDGGSIYWVIKRQIQVRQSITALEPITGKDGIRRCAIILEPQLIATRPQPRRAFQGWRYLRGEDSPVDLPQGADLRDMPPQMRDELLQLGLI